MRFATRAIRVGQNPDGDFRAVVNPIYQSATFAWQDLDHVPAIDYTRCANPNRKVAESVIAALENAEHCLCTGSGMSAVIAAFSLLESGDHLLMAGDIYGGTHRVAETILPKHGIQVSEFDARQPESLRIAAKPNSKMVVFETPTNPNLTLADIRAISAEAHKLGLLSVLDNTFASPYLQNPLELGADIVIHSTTKYIGGHSDVIGGAVVTNDSKLHEKFVEFSKTVGVAPSPFDLWLTVRGAKTLELRMERHCSNALAVAQFLEKHPKVARVHYPGLPSHPDHELAKRQMRAFGGMVSFEVDGAEADARRVAESTRIFLLAESLGGVESLIGYPPLMSHACMTEEQRLQRGILPTGLRLSVGIESIEDLLEDLDEALAAVFPASRAQVQLPNGQLTAR